MVWAPTLIKQVFMDLSLSGGIDDKTDAQKVKSIHNKINEIENAVFGRTISNRELVSCEKIIEQNQNLLDSIRGESEALKALKQSIGQLFAKIHQSSAPLLAAAPQATSAAQKSQEPVLNLVFICDIDGGDHNGSLASGLGEAIRQGIPCITSKSVLSQSDNEDKQDSKSNKLLLFKNQQQWKIYKKGDLVVFIPKNYPFKEEELGFNVSKEDQVKDLSEIFDGPTKQTSVDDFFPLFQEDSKVDLRMELHGHGGEGVIGGLRSQHYHQLLNFLKPRCKFLKITSCFGGDTNTLDHYIEIPAKQSAEKAQSKQGKDITKGPPPFPILVSSIGAFMTATRRQYTEFFNSVDKFLIQSKYTTPHLRKLVDKLDLTWGSFGQIQFPHTPDSPLGFRAIGEKASASLISRSSLQALKIKSRIPSIHLKDTDYLELLPLHIDIPMHISTTPRQLQTVDTHNPIVVTHQPLGSPPTQSGIQQSCSLFSMIPGKAHHLINEVHTDSFGLFDLFLTQAVQVYQDSSAKKTFYIGKFQAGHRIYSNVALDFTKKPFHLFYSEGEPLTYHCYEFDYQTKTLTELPTTENDFVFNLYNLAKISAPTAQSVRLSSGGQEDDYTFIDSLISVFAPKLKEFKLYCEYKNEQNQIAAKKGSSKEIEEKLVKAADKLAADTDPQAHQALLESALRDNDLYLVTALIKRGNVDLNKKNMRGNSPLGTAIINNPPNLVQLLIDNHADLNAPCTLPSNHSPLKVAVTQNNAEIIKLLLHHYKTIDFQHIDVGQKSALQCCKNREMFQLIYEAIKKKLIEENVPEKEWESALKRAINEPQTDATLLTVATLMKDKPFIEQLLKLGADPYLGKPSVLSTAIARRDPEMVHYWLDKKIDPTRPNQDGTNALETACKKGTTEILSLILSKVDLTLLPNPSSYLLQALQSGHMANARILQKAGIGFDTLNEKLNLSLMFELFFSKEFALIDKVLEKATPESFHATDINTSEDIFSLALDDPSLKLAPRCIKLCKLTLDPWKPEFYRFLWNAYGNKNKPVMELLIRAGADPTYGEGFMSEVLDRRDLDTLEFLAGIVPDFDLDRPLTARQLLDYYKTAPSLFEFCLNKGKALEGFILVREFVPLLFSLKEFQVFDQILEKIPRKATRVSYRALQEILSNALEDPNLEVAQRFIKLCKHVQVSIGGLADFQFFAYKKNKDNLPFLELLLKVGVEEPDKEIIEKMLQNNDLKALKLYASYAPNLDNLDMSDLSDETLKIRWKEFKEKKTS